MNLITCPNHPGLIIENQPCPKCGHPQVLPKGRAPYKHEWLQTSETKGVTVSESTSSSTLELQEVEPEEELTGDGTGEALPPVEETTEPWCGRYEKRPILGEPCEDVNVYGVDCSPDCESWVGDKPGEMYTWEPQPTEKRRPDYRVIDANTGELQQLSLLGAQREEYKVESLRLSLSGGDEFIKSMFDELVDGELSPGAIVEVVCRGIVKEHAPVFKKDGHEGKTVILLEVVRRITVLGHMTGKVEAAQNVDGEAKVLEGDTEPAFGETGGADGETDSPDDEMPEQPACFGNGVNHASCDVENGSECQVSGETEEATDGE